MHHKSPDLSQNKTMMQPSFQISFVRSLLSICIVGDEYLVVVVTQYPLTHWHYLDRGR